MTRRQLYDQILPGLVGRARKMSRFMNSDIWQDWTQEAMITVEKTITDRLNGHIGEDDVKLLASCAHNRVTDLYRMTRNDRLVIKDSVEAVHSGHLHEVDTRITADQLTRILSGRLSEIFRLVFDDDPKLTNVMLEDKTSGYVPSDAQISRAIGVSKTTMSRIRSALISFVKENGLI